MLYTSEESLFESTRKKPWIFNAMLVLFGVTFILMLIFLICTITLGVKKSVATSPAKPKNIIFMVGDGFGPASQTFARVTSKRGQLPLDKIFVGSSRTYSSSSPVTDSAAGATAFACALKSYNGAWIHLANPVEQY
ncbi:hypothetical protein AKO1_015589 [Acrasis kona]|uniref:alkaline phosphatase n=1 Tax=Acrasis kona TaxID=1008807 RepID=A0AAW2ZF27_9EUKA